MFGCTPREYTSPFGKSEIPEFHFSDDLDEIGIKRYQTMIGCQHCCSFVLHLEKEFG
jgi:hypothetical protein